jgi:hypothetical protein
LPISEDTPCELIESFIIRLETIVADYSRGDTERTVDEINSLTTEYGPKLSALQDDDAREAVMNYGWAILQLTAISGASEGYIRSNGVPDPRLRFQGSPEQLAILTQIAKKERERALRECR